MRFPDWLPVYGDKTFRGTCPIEDIEQMTFFNKLRREYPDSYGLIALHPKNEAKLIGGQFRALSKDKAMGMAPGASDIVIPGSPTFVCEMKRADHTKSKWQPGQLTYLEAAQKQGAFVCVALGWEAAMQAFNEWLELQPKGKTQ